MAKTFLPAALLITAALAAPRPDVEVVQVRQISRRQDTTDTDDLSDLLPTDIDLSDLSSAIPTDLDLSSIIGGLATLLPSGCAIPTEFASVPTPPADVQSALISYTDYCNEPSFTGSVGAHYTSYLSAAESWASANGDAFSSWTSQYATACPYATAFASDESDLSSLFASYSVTVPSCSGSATSAKQTGSNTAKATGSATTGTATTGSATGSSGSAQSGNNTGAAPQQTAFAAVAGVVAGFAGMVAYL